MPGSPATPEPAQGPALAPQAPTQQPRPQPQPLCAAATLQERGQAHVFEVRLWSQTTRAFAMRFEGQVVAYINRCAHVPVEMDGPPGRFLDMDKRWILCSIHGASYEPANGQCVGGPCGRGRLMPIQTLEAGGQVYWYPSQDIRPLAPAAPVPTESAP